MAENDNSLLKLFGFELKKVQKNKQERPEKLPSIVPKTDDDGAGYVTASGAHFGQYVDIEGNEAKDNAELIKKYRGIAQHPEVDAAIEDIVNESISGSDQEAPVDINLDHVEASDKVKKIMIEEFDNICSMLNFTELAHDMFRSWYIDGRLVHHLVVNESNLKAGIQEIRPIDAVKVRKAVSYTHLRAHET